MSLPITKSDIDLLIGALNRLSVALEASTATTSSTSTSPTISIAGWELVEPISEQPFKVALQFRRVFEDGPQPIPNDLLTIAAGKLSSVAGDPRERVTRAWRAGFWAWAAVSTHSPYSRAEAISLSDTQWIIANHPRSTGPIRVRKLGDLRQLLASIPPGAEEPCYQGFASLTEVQIFCASYGIDTPPLYQCSAQR